MFRETAGKKNTLMGNNAVIRKLIFVAVSFLSACTFGIGQKACFEDCWSRMENSSSPFAALDILKEIQGCQAPDFNVETIEGEVLSLKGLSNSVTVINFWFIGCKPCIEEMPRLNNLVDSYSRKDVVFLSFARDSKEDIERKFLPKRLFKYKIISGKHNISKQYCIQAYPTHIVIGKSGNVEFASFDSVEKDENYKQLKLSIDKALVQK